MIPLEISSAISVIKLIPGIISFLKTVVPKILPHVPALMAAGKVIANNPDAQAVEAAALAAAPAMNAVIGHLNDAVTATVAAAKPTTQIAPTSTTQVGPISISFGGYTITIAKE
jgi:hypothetical protein